MIRFNSEWRAHWDGHTIIVRNWWSLFLATGEELWVDGTPRDRHGGAFRITSTLDATCREGTDSFTVRAYLWPASPVRIGCHIYVNGQLVGGDMDERPWFRESEPVRETPAVFH